VLVGAHARVEGVEEAVHLEIRQRKLIAQPA